MKTFALEMSTAKGSIALRDEGALLFDVSFAADRKHSGAFFENVQLCLERFGQPQKIVVGTGPGSYAGVRIAIATGLGLRSAIREVTAGNTASALWSTARESLAEQIRSQLSSTVEPRGIMLERILLRDVRPPATVRQAIEAKQQADQEAQRMVYVLQKERQEADRKRIEAQGIADFQKIVTQGISQPLLVWKGIEATETLAKSPNTKVIVIGNTRNGLPLILEPGGVP